MKPDEKTIKALIRGIEKYNKAKTAKEGFGTLNNLINIGEKELKNSYKKKQVEDFARLTEGIK